MASSIFTAAFWKGAGERAIKTTAQAAVAAIGVNQVGILDVDWKSTLSLAVAAGVLSILTSIGNGDFTAGKPAEPTPADDDDTDDVDAEDEDHLAELEAEDAEELPLGEEPIEEGPVEAGLATGVNPEHAAEEEGQTS